LGIVGLLVLNFIQTITSKKALPSPTSKEVRNLMLAGTSLGCTSLFYYIAVQYINVSIAIVLLMQSVWFSVVVESFLTKNTQCKKNRFCNYCFGGNYFSNQFNQRKLGFGLERHFLGIIGSSFLYAYYVYFQYISDTFACFQKSIIMLLGGSVVVFAFLFFAQIIAFRRIKIFLPYRQYRAYSFL
jgi:drug/metabolite transporter (DMT)-like permease